MDFERLRQVRNENNPFAQWMGISLTHIHEGTATAEVEVAKEYLNPVASCHGGVLFTLADVACGAAAASFGRHVVTVSVDYRYLRSAGEGERIRALARTVKCGRNLIMLQAEVTQCSDGKLLGTASATYYRLDQEIDL